MSANPQDDLRAAYDAGFEASGEGWNGEYPAGVMEEAGYKMGRAQWIAHFILDAPVASAPAPSDPAGAGGDLGELERLSKAATQGFWRTASFVYPDEDGGEQEQIEGIQVHNSDGAGSIIQCLERDAAYIIALVNAHRSGQLVASTPGQKGAGEEKTGACLTAPDHSASPSPQAVSALTGECSSRGWQPISTAPKDGKPILAVWAGYVPVCAHWLTEHERWLTFAPDEFDSKKDLEEHLAATMYKPTHWMPLPEGPALAGEARSAETQSGSVEDEHAARRATPAQTPPSPPSAAPEGDPPMTVEEAREVLNSFDTHVWPNPADYVSYLRKIACEVPHRPQYQQSCRTFASRIELALRTLHAAGEVR